MLKTKLLYLGTAILSLIATSSTAVAQDDKEDICLSLDTAITVVRTQEFAPLIAEAADTAAEEVDFLGFMNSGNWSVVYAATPNADPGYFFFEDVDGQNQFKDVWGGIAYISEHDEQVAYAGDLGAPSELAACFADNTAIIDE